MDKATGTSLKEPAQPEAGSQAGSPKCRFCAADLELTFVDLGMSPLCESYVPAEKLNDMECFYPLHVYVCTDCLLVQLEEFVPAEEIFTEYAYFSSYADSWVEHSRQYVEMVIKRFSLNEDSQVIELASNDGYLLQHFLPHSIPVLGVEPAVNVAKVAMEKNIPTLTEFFNTQTAGDMVESGTRADLLLGNNVLAQVPDLNDFVAAMKLVLKPEGVITMEFPHLLTLMRENQFDTIYHEHFSYFSMLHVTRLFAHHGLRLFDVEQIPTHGGSLRIYACHDDDASKAEEPAVVRVLDEEKSAGLEHPGAYQAFDNQVKETKRKLLSFLIEAKREGKQIVGYGAPGKGNTLLNYCGIRTDFLDYTVDRNPYKQGKFLPGTHIPIHAPDRIRETRPDYVLVLPWNFRQEIIEQNEFIREWGGQFVVPIPEVEII